jgi:16S rRNA (adenine1518-N6/adenine1519-N6)-dimethyltransferase
VEVDRSMCYHLRGKFANHPRFRLVEADFLKVEETIMDTEFGAIKSAAPEPDAAAGTQELESNESTSSSLPENLPSPGKPFKIVGNLPYGITSRIMFKLAGEIEQEQYAWRDRIQQLTVMVQKEVAERITAIPGQRAYNALSIALQLRFDIRLEAIVPARNFYPAPQVDSAVITLIPRQEPLLPPGKTDMALFAKLVRTAFSAKRKTVRNALLNGRFATAAVIDQVFAATGIASDLRAEALSIAAFGELTHAFSLHPRQS